MTPSVRSAATNFTVVRVKRDILRRSSHRRAVHVPVGRTGRAGAQRGVSASTARSRSSTTWPSTRTGRETRDRRPDRRRHELSRAAGLRRRSVRRAARTPAVGANFNPEVGFVRRDDMRRNFGLFRFSPRPKSAQGRAQVCLDRFDDHTENSAGRLETRDIDGEFAVEFQNSDRFGRRRSTTTTSSCRTPFRHRARLGHAGGRLLIHQRAQRLHIRPTAARVRQRVAGARYLLRR